MAQHPEDGFANPGLPVQHLAASMSPQSATHSTGGGPIGTPNRNMIACLSCRRQKIKCHPSPTSPPDPCRRCARMELTCDFLKHNRGRKKKVRAEDGEETKENVLVEMDRDDRMDGDGGRDVKMRGGVEGEYSGRSGAQDNQRQDVDRSGPSVPPSMPQIGSSSFSRIAPLPVVHQLAALIEGQDQQSRSWSNKEPGSQSGDYVLAPNLSMTAAVRVEKPSLETILRPALSSPLDQPPPSTAQTSLSLHAPLHNPTTTNPPAAPIFSLRSMLEPWQDSDDSSSASDDLTTEREYLGPDIDANIERQVPTGLPTAGTLKMAQERARAGRRGVGVSRGGNARMEDTEGERPRKRRREEGGMGNDPVSMGFMSEEKARELFRLYMVLLNPNVGLLDPENDSFESVRAHSSFLLTAVLSTSTRPYRTDLPTSLSSHQLHLQTLSLARQHATIALAGCERSVDVVKALMMMGMWKEVEDERAEGFVNRAILVAKEIHLDRPRNNLTLSPFEKREYHANQRLLFKLFILNSLCSILNDQPILIDAYNQLLSTVDEWFQSSSHPEEDISTIANVQLFKKYHQLSEALSAPSFTLGRGGARLSDITSRRIGHDLEETRGVWLKRMEELPNPQPIHELKINISLVYLQLSVLQLRSLNPSTSSAVVTPTGSNRAEEQLVYRALTASLEMVKEFAGMESGALTHAPDHLLSIIPLPISLLTSISSHPFLSLPTSYTDSIQSLTRDVINQLMLASLRGTDWCASMGRFVRDLSAGVVSHGDGTDWASQASGTRGHGIPIMEWVEVYEGWREHVRREGGWNGDVGIGGMGGSGMTGMTGMTGTSGTGTGTGTGMTGTSGMTGMSS